MSASPANAGQHQLVYRQPTEDEPLSTLTLGPVVLWLDVDREVVIVEVPPGYEMTVVRR